MAIEPPFPYPSALEIEAELEDYIDTLVEPVFADHLKNFAIELAKSKAIVILDLIDITTTLSKPGKSWIENIEWDITKQSSSITDMISVIESKGLNINSAQKILVWFKVGSTVSLSEIDPFNEQINLIGNEDSEFVYGFKLKEDESELLSCTILISGLTEYPETSTHSFMDKVAKESLTDFISDLSYKNVRNFYFEAIYNTLLEPEKKISAIKAFNHNNKDELLIKTLEINKLNSDLQKKIPSDCGLYKKMEKDRVLEWRKVLTVLRNENFPFYEDLPK
jgi:hypothetical protein